MFTWAQEKAILKIVKLRKKMKNLMKLQFRLTKTPISTKIAQWLAV